VLARRGRHADGGEDAIHDVVGIGNALVDVIGHVDDGFLDTHGLVKGTMALVDTEAALSLYRAMGGGVETSGGSAANTIAGVAGLGGRAGFIGKVGRDDLGATFAADMASIGVEFRSVGNGGTDLPTGRCIIAVTPDAQRTMSTFLGVSAHLTFDDVDESLVGSGAVLYMEGYLFDRDEAKQAFHDAAAIAHGAGRVVSLTLSDAFCVDRHRDDFLSLIRAEVDLLFGNESELLSLYETADFDDAIAALRRDSHVAVVTRSEKGAVVVTRDEVVTVPAVPVAAVVDTTGAGDLFAAGFLSGFTAGFDLERCARLGAAAAAEVIAHVGPRPAVRLVDAVPADLVPGSAR
jgi:sugar/nucleoside kinase (ribokinase family)